MREAEGGDELSEAEESSSEAERIHYEVAGKLLRFFTHADDDYFYLFLECGVKRTFHVKPIYEYTYLELSVTIPKPPDALFHFVGIEQATDVNIEATEEIIYIHPPRKLSTKREVRLHYPSDAKPLFTIFKYEMEVAVDPVEAEEKIDLTKMFTEDKK
jgi:hypothetical protein